MFTKISCHSSLFFTTFLFFGLTLVTRFWTEDHWTDIGMVMARPHWAACFRRCGYFTKQSCRSSFLHILYGTQHWTGVHVHKNVNVQAFFIPCLHYELRLSMLLSVWLSFENRIFKKYCLSCWAVMFHKRRERRQLYHRQHHKLVEKLWVDWVLPILKGLLCNTRGLLSVGFGLLVVIHLGHILKYFSNQWIASRCCIGKAHLMTWKYSFMFYHPSSS